MKKWVVLLALLGVSGLFLPCEAQQIMYANLRELVECDGDTVTTLRVERRSKNQILLMGGGDYRIEAVDNRGLSRYLNRRCYAVRIDTALYVNCRKMRYKRYRFGNCYAATMHVGDKFYFCAQPVGQAATSRPSRPTPRSWAARWAMPLPRRRWWLPACSTKSIPRPAVPSLWARTR